MKSVFSPHHGRHVKFGRIRSASRPRLFFKSYLAEHLGALPTPPTSADYSKPAATVLADIMGNDTLGDCVIAGAYHVCAVETGNAGDLFHATSAQIIHDYSAIGGYVPGDESTDNGCDLQTALNYWQKTGFANKTKLLGHIAIDATNQQEVELACYLFENLYFGLALPDAWVNPFPSGNGFTWSTAGSPDPSNGHCIMGYGFNSTGVLIDSWGMLGTLTWAAVKKYAAASAGGELYAMLSPDQLAKGQQKAPNGIDWSALISDFDSMGGNVTPQPSPPAPPAPQPPAPPAPPKPVSKTTTITITGTDYTVTEK